MIRGIIFDYGNTLAKSPSLVDAFVSVFEHEKASEIGKEIDKSILKLYTPDQKDQPDWLIVWKNAFHKYGVQFEKEIGIKHLRTFVNRNEIYSYSKPLLSDLKRKHLKLALLGNVTGPAEIFHNDLVQRGLNHYFDSITWSSEIGYRKPSREAFQDTLDKMGLKADEVLMVGDSEIADIEGASKIGMKSLRIYEGNKPENSEADFLSSRDEVRDRVQAITSQLRR